MCLYKISSGLLEVIQLSFCTLANDLLKVMNMFSKEIIFFLISFPLFVDAIIGGEYVYDPHKYPWMVNIVSFDIENNETSDRFPDLSKIPICGGAIISENIILTAAHCVQSGWSEYSRGSEYSKKTATFVRIGHPIIDYSVTVKVKSKMIHPKFFRYLYRPSKLGLKYVTNNDIALLELSEDLKFNWKIQPIPLPDEDFDEANYLEKSRSKFMVAGWGSGFDIPNDFYNSKMWTVHKSKIPKEKYLKKCGMSAIISLIHGMPEPLKCEDNIKLVKPGILKVTEVDYIKLGNDSNNYKKKKVPVQIRAMSTNPYIPGICHGDSGSPLMKLDVTSGKYELVGIVSSKHEWHHEQMGPRGCLGPNPAVYTRVSAFVPWIKESMAKVLNPDSFMQVYQGYSSYGISMGNYSRVPNK